MCFILYVCGWTQSWASSARSSCEVFRGPRPLSHLNLQIENPLRMTKSVVFVFVLTTPLRLHLHFPSFRHPKSTIVCGRNRGRIERQTI